MDESHRTDKRLMDLEVKASFLEDLVEELNKLVISQQLQLDRLTREVTALRDQMPEQGQVPFRSLRDELPPHY
ncbi:MAG TPA: SlyX family protein [Aquabacterium sp.]|nr:SlyX family protein [Aquabacterium sp.]